MGFAAVKIIWISVLRSTKKSMGMLWARFNAIYNRWNRYQKITFRDVPREIVHDMSNPSVFESIPNCTIKNELNKHNWYIF